ncbi:hypothetical protein HNQ50_003037 [Silvimonas terrae]|uniref:Uncharacterized protein n=1 Tax=Silvimonas terrae TaxID=300266 RepID=A0A840RJ11_9NEIS|nr:hypothetical protein [Silvimonas terrae]MBB5192296.1 hypothetical protein [Silvimonas terrae]
MAQEIDKNHSGKLRSYQSGTHGPNVETVAAVNRHVPGTARFLDQVLWSAIGGRLSTTELWVQGLMQFAPTIQAIVVELDAYGQSTGEPPLATVRHLRKLQQCASPEALACLIILLRHAAETGNTKLSLGIGRAVFSVSLIVCSQFPYNLMARELFELLREHVFVFASSDEERLDFSGVDFVGSVQALSDCVLRMEGEKWIKPGEVAARQALIKVMNGRHGLDVPLTLMLQIRSEKRLKI